MRLRDRRLLKQPELVIIPMIDIMFFLLVFFMVSTMYMVNLKTIPIKLPVAAHSSVDAQTTFAVSVKSDNTIWLNDRKTDINTLVMQAAAEGKNNPNFSVAIRAAHDADYGQVITLLDKLKGAGITRFGLATDNLGGADTK